MKIVLFQEVCQGTCNESVIADKATIITREAKESTQASEICWRSPLQNGLNFGRVNSNTFLGDNVSKVVYFFHTKGSFRKFGKEFMVA